jgi:CBS domain-containing protein
MALTARDVMTSPVRSVSPEMSLPDLERAFIESRLSGFPVVEEGKLVGMVSRSDIVRQLTVEQSVGEMLSDFYREYGGRDTQPGNSLEAIAQHIGGRLERYRVRDVMVPELLCAAPDEPLVALAQRLLEEGIHRLPVVQDGRLLGIVTSHDFVRLVAEGRVRAA